MLEESRRKELDAIVGEMINNKESDANIRFVVDDFKKKYSATPSASPMATQPESNPYNASFRAKDTDTPLTAGLKAAGNLPSSALNLAKNVKDAVISPVDTLRGVGQTFLGGVGKILPGKQQEEEVFDSFTQSLKDRYGSLDNLRKTAVEDPFGFGSEVLGLFTGGAALAGKGAAATKAISKTAGLVTKPVSKLATKGADTVGKLTRFGVSQATGLDPETISTLTRSPEAFSGGVTTRAELAGGVKAAIDRRLNQLSDLGGGYDEIRKIPVTAQVDPTWIDKTLDRFGLKIVDGRVRGTTKSITRNSADLRAIQDIYDNWANKADFAPDEALNLRKDIGELSKFDRASGKTSASETVGKALYEDVNKSLRPQIPGLEKLDAEFAPEVKLLNKIRKDYLTKTGEFKDGALNKIANVTGKGKDQVLSRLEQIVPDIKQRVAVVKATEDIANAFGQKVGTYLRAGAGIAGVATGNVPLIVGTILANPAIAVPLLKGYGYTAKNIGPIIRALNKAAGDVNNFRIPAAVQGYIDDPQLGLSVKDVSRIPKSAIPAKIAKLMDDMDLEIITDYLDDPDLANFEKAYPLMEEMGITKADTPTQNAFLREVVREKTGSADRKVLVKPKK